MYQKLLRGPRKLKIKYLTHKFKNIKVISDPDKLISIRQNWSRSEENVKEVERKTINDNYQDVLLWLGAEK